MKIKEMRQRCIAAVGTAQVFRKMATPPWRKTTYAALDSWSVALSVTVPSVLIGLLMAVGVGKFWGAVSCLSCLFMLSMFRIMDLLAKILYVLHYQTTQPPKPEPAAYPGPPNWPPHPADFWATFPPDRMGR